MENGPIRSCAGCRRRRPQGELIRIVRRSDGVASVDPATLSGHGRARRRPAGRGAYVCPDEVCVRRALASGALRRALRLAQAPSPELIAELRAGSAARAAEPRGEEGQHG